MMAQLLCLPMPEIGGRTREQSACSVSRKGARVMGGRRWMFTELQDLFSRVKGRLSGPNGQHNCFNGSYERSGTIDHEPSTGNQHDPVRMGAPAQATGVPFVVFPDA